MERRKSQSRKPERKADDFGSSILDLARVTRVQRGGKRLRFRACVAVGDKKGAVGIGIAKGSDVSSAVEKATRRAKRSLVHIPLTEVGSIPHSVSLCYKASKIIFRPAPSGTGIKAGGVIRTICDLAGVKNITAKILGTNNKIANAQAIVESMQLFKI